MTGTWTDHRHNVGVGVLFFLACAFPTIGPLSGSTDVQPWAFLVAIGALLGLGATSVRVPRAFLWFLLVGALCVGTFLLDLATTSFLYEENPLSGARLMFTVISLPLISLAVVKLGYQLDRKVFLVVYGIWMTVGIIQLFVPGFLGFLLPRLSTSAGRGVVSLAPEPDHYGRVVIAFTVLAFFLAIRGRLSRRELIAITGLSAFQIFFLSRALSSALIYVVVAIPLLWHSFTSRAARSIIVFGFLTGVAGVLWIGFLLIPDARVFYLLRMLLEDPSVWTKQGGFIARFFNPFLSIQVGLFETAGRGAGLGRTLVPGMTTELWPFGIEVLLPDRAHGGLVGLIYSAGVIGLLYVVTFYRILLKALRRVAAMSGRKIVAAGLVAMTMVFFFDQSLADPLRAYVFGYLLLLAAEPVEAPVEAIAPQEGTLLQSRPT